MVSKLNVNAVSRNSPPLVLTVFRILLLCEIISISIDHTEKFTLNLILLLKSTKAWDMVNVPNGIDLILLIHA